MRHLKTFAYIAIFLFAASASSSAAFQRSSPESVIRSFYLEYCRAADPALSAAEAKKRQAAAEKKYVTPRLIRELKDFYKNNPAADGDYYIQGSGVSLASITEVKIEATDTADAQFSAKVTLLLGEDEVEVLVTLVKQKNSWKLDRVAAA